jgi:cytochrome oxidase assembly protein ShyY1
LTPFQIEGGPITLVNRGFVPDGAAVPAPPSGTLRIGGYARQTEVRETGQLSDDASSTTDQVRRVDIPLISKKLDLDLAPVYVSFIGSQPASPTPPTPVPAPDLSGGPPHVGYTVQWCIFSVCAVVGWVFAVRRTAHQRRRQSQTDATSELSADPARPSA